MFVSILAQGSSSLYISFGSSPAHLSCADHRSVFATLVQRTHYAWAKFAMRT